MDKNNITLIAGPKQMEDDYIPFLLAKDLKEMCERLGLNFIFKSDIISNDAKALKKEVGLNILYQLGKDMRVETMTNLIDLAQIKEMIGKIDHFHIKDLPHSLDIEMVTSLILFDKKNQEDTANSLGNLIQLVDEKQGGNDLNNQFAVNFSEVFTSWKTNGDELVLSSKDKRNSSFLASYLYIELPTIDQEDKNKINLSLNIQALEDFLIKELELVS